VPFSRDFSTYTVIPASDILNLRVPVSLTAGKLVLVGSSSLGLADSVATPLLSNTSGMLVHAAMLTSLLDQSEGRAPHPWPGSLLAFVFSAIVILVSTYALPRLSAIVNSVLLLTASAAWIVFAYWIAPHDGSFTTTGPLVSFLLLLAVAIPYHWHLSQRRSRKLLDTLNHYVAPVIVNEILSSGLKDPLAPRQHYMTTLVADMEGYTKHIEGLPLDEAASLTRQFLDCLTQPVLDCRGTLDKYTGDGLVAFWGAPIRDVDHADLALDAALQMANAVKSLNESRSLAGKPPMRVRIGIESGDAMSGDFGSSSRSIYTAVGDSVNTASRLQEAARDYPHDIIVGQGAAQIIKRHQLMSLGKLQLRGKQNPTELFTPI
jgi:adenylate cyclase